MADNKYADLPGIARDEPDVYETSDLPESDQTPDFCEEANDAIERIHVSVNDAFNKFKGKSIEGTKVDFSDRISKRIRTGYDLRSGEWELVGEGETESPLQKYQRLQCEMKELLEEVKTIKDDKKDDQHCLISAAQVEQSLKKLEDLKLVETLGKDIVASINDPQGAQIKKLMAQLESLKAAASEKPESQSQVDGVVFQLNYRPEQMKLAQTSRIAELEKRLHRLETVLGASSDKLQRLTSATSKGSLLEAAEHLSATASMLDSAQLDHIEGRLSALSQKLDAITNKKLELQQDGEQDKMILELYELVKNTENMSKVLPKTIERLEALQNLHQSAFDCVSTCVEIDNVHSDAIARFEENKLLLESMKSTLAANMEQVNKSVSDMDKRLKAIKK